MTSAAISKNNNIINVYSGQDELLDTLDYVMPKDCINIIQDYLKVKIDITALFLKTIALPYIQDPELKASIEEGAQLYGKDVEHIDLGRTTFYYNYGKAGTDFDGTDVPYPPQNWFENRVDEVLTKFFPKVKLITTPAYGEIKLNQNAGYRKPDHHPMSLKEYKRVNLTVLPSNVTQYNCIMTASENTPSYDCTISQERKKIRISMDDGKTDREIFSAEMTEPQKPQSLSAQFQEKCTISDQSDS